MDSSISNHQTTTVPASGNHWKQVGAFHFQDRMLGSVGLREEQTPQHRPLSAMPKVLHAIQISSLATWSSFASIGFLGLWLGMAPPQSINSPPKKSELTQEILIGSDPVVKASRNSPPSSHDAMETPTPSVVSMPEVPDLPEITNMTPLPEIPNIPEPQQNEITPQPTSKRPTSPRQPTGNKNASTKPQENSTSGKRNDSTRNNTSRNGQAGIPSNASNDSSRIAAGRMPAPMYPSDARKLGQAGTVVVEFTVDTAGKVISARAKIPSQHALLDNEAIRTVRRWKFPPGPGILKLERPITFKLN